MRRTADASNELLVVERRRRGTRSSSAICERRARARRLRRASPRSGWRRRTCRPGRRRCRRGRRRLTCTSGTSCASTSHTGRPFDERALLDRRQRQLRRRAERGRLRAIGRCCSRRRREHADEQPQSTEDQHGPRDRLVTIVLGGRRGVPVECGHRFASGLHDELDAPIARQPCDDRRLDVGRRSATCSAPGPRRSSPAPPPAK